MLAQTELSSACVSQRGGCVCFCEQGMGVGCLESLSPLFTSEGGGGAKCGAEEEEGSRSQWEETGP